MAGAPAWGLASGQEEEVRGAWRCSGTGLCAPVPSSGRGENGDLRFSHNLVGCGLGDFLFRCPGSAYSTVNLRILFLF